MYELINNVPLQVKEYKGQRVVTFKDIDMVHNRPEGTAGRNFRKNREYFIEGKDYFTVCADEIRRNKIMDISPKTHADVILVTEYGYMMIVKSLTDDLSWNIQRLLVDNYFRAKAINNSYAELLELLRSDLKSDIEETVNRALDKKLKDIVEISNRKIENTVNKALDKKFKTLDRKFRTLAKALSKQSKETIIDSVSETTLSMVPYFDTMDKIVWTLCNKLLQFSDTKRTYRKR